MSRGGNRTGSGRPKGSKNVKTIELIDKAVGDGQTPLEFLLGVMNDMENMKNLRIDAAKAAAPYVHSKLTTIDATIDTDITMKITEIVLLAPDLNDAD